jgi:hypothetical protein
LLKTVLSEYSWIHPSHNLVEDDYASNKTNGIVLLTHW